LASELLVATRSAHKLAEIRAILTGVARLKLVTLSDLNVPAMPAEDDIETHASFLDNATAKARYFASLTGRPTLADDSGIAVDALGGAPGVRTRRFAIDHNFVAPDTSGPDLDRANNRLLLEKLAEVPEHQRGAHYVCAAACALNHRVVATSIGTCRGVIARDERGSGGFGYDPLFIIPALGVRFAELSAEEKNQRSHRAIAFRALAPQLR
jgi:XTP/dITP diphosphohydrolase